MLPSPKCAQIDTRIYFTGSATEEVHAPELHTTVSALRSLIVSNFQMLYSCKYSDRGPGLCYFAKRAHSIDRNQQQSVL